MGELEALLKAAQHSRQVFQGKRLSSGSRPGAEKRTVLLLRVVVPWGSRYKAPRGRQLKPQKSQRTAPEVPVCVHTCRLSLPLCPDLFL